MSLRTVCIAMTLLAAACTGGASELPEDIAVGIEGPTGVVDLEDGASLPIFFGPAGGYMLRVFLGGDTYQACANREGASLCRVVVKVSADDGTQLSYDFKKELHEGGTEFEEWPFVVLALIDPSLGDLGYDEFVGTEGSLQVQLSLDSLTAQTPAFHGVFAAASDF